MFNQGIFVCCIIVAYYMYYTVLIVKIFSNFYGNPAIVDMTK